MAPRTRSGESAKKQLKLSHTVSKEPPPKGQTTQKGNPKKDDPKNQKDEPIPPAAAGDIPKKDDPKNQEDEPMQPAAAGAEAGPVKLEPARDGEEEAASGRGADLATADSVDVGSQDAASGADPEVDNAGSQDAVGADLVKAGSGSAGSQDAAPGAADPVIKVEPAAT